MSRESDTPHLCDCGDCAVQPFDDRCKYELALHAIVTAGDQTEEWEAIDRAKTLFVAESR